MKKVMVILAGIFFGCAADRALREENTKLRAHLAQHDTEFRHLQRMRELQSALQTPRSESRYEDAPRGVLTPPPDVGFLGRPPFGWGERGNQGRSVELKNTEFPENKYWLRVWIDNQEVVLTPGNGVYAALVQTLAGPKMVSLFPPGGHTYHLVNVGKHDIIWERYLGYGEDFQYVETCEIHGVDFDKNTFPRGVFRFGGALCSRRSPSD